MFRMSYPASRSMGWVFVVFVLFTLVAALSGSIEIDSQAVLAAENQQRAAHESYSTAGHRFRAARTDKVEESAWSVHADTHLLHARALLTGGNRSHKQELPDISAGLSALFTLPAVQAAGCTKPSHPSVAYLVDGQYLRKDITDGQPGIDLTLHIQFVDHVTCKPIEALYVDVWHANASGVYSGIKAVENAGGADLLDTNFLRGVAATNADGILTFITKFPGHYTGRTAHIHVLASYQGTVNTNSTYGTDYTPLQTAQIFFDQDLLNEVYTVSPYDTNITTRVTNAYDFVYEVLSNGAFDPHMNYALQGANVSDGVIGWIRIGVDLETTPNNIRAAGTIGVPDNAGPRPIPTIAPAPPIAEAGLQAPPGVVPDVVSGACREQPCCMMHAVWLWVSVFTATIMLAMAR